MSSQQCRPAQKRRFAYTHTDNTQCIQDYQTEANNLCDRQVSAEASLQVSSFLMTHWKHLIHLLARQSSFNSVVVSIRKDALHWWFGSLAFTAVSALSFSLTHSLGLLDSIQLSVHKPQKCNAESQDLKYLESKLPTLITGAFAPRWDSAFKPRWTGFASFGQFKPFLWGFFDAYTAKQVNKVPSTQA